MFDQLSSLSPIVIVLIFSFASIIAVNIFAQLINLGLRLYIKAKGL